MKKYLKKLCWFFLKHKKGPDNIPPVNGIDFGDFNRLTPFSTDWGFKRGGAVDRYYIEKFLSQNAGDIKGAGIEVLNDHYLKKYGKDKITSRDIIDINKNNADATIYADLSNATNIESNKYDCFVFTQTLHLIYDLHSTIQHIHRILKPGGVLLLTVPGISHFPYENPRYWAFTEFSIRKLLEEEFPVENIEVEIHGNVLTSTAFLYGVGATELTEPQYEYKDNSYQLIITARAVKK